jgi:Tfp pilus assembly protein PilF
MKTRAFMAEKNIDLQALSDIPAKGMHVPRILLALLATLAFGQTRAFGQTPVFAQTEDPAYTQLDRAYQALRAKDYDAAVSAFERAIALAPDRPSIHKDLAYALLKIGENTRAREHFAQAMRLDPGDTHVALEYAFLCYETGEPVIARRTFDRLRASDSTAAPTAKEAFENIDRPLREGIARWKEAVLVNPSDYSGHEELARLAEQRDETDLAAEHFEKAWRLRPERRELLLDLGRTWKALGRSEDANAALLAASRGASPRVAEQAREFLPARYPYVYEFQKALELDPTNAELRRELGYLHMAMGQDAEAEQQFARVVDAAPQDLLSTAQLGLLRLKEGDEASSRPLLRRVLAGNDPVLAERVRQQALSVPQILDELSPEPGAGEPRAKDPSAKELGMKSYEKGYLRDALKYLAVAHENNPADFEVTLKLGWTNNILKNDREASRWFDLARQSPDPQTAAEASKAFHNLAPEVELFRTTVWVFPMFSTRWHDLFGYAQTKTEIRVPHLPWLRLYSSLRFVGDTHGAERFANGWAPQYLSEDSVILGAGIATQPWHGATAWFEAGESFHFRPQPLDTSTAAPDYRGGVSFTRAIAARHWFAETNDDMVYVSRFDNDTLFYSQNRFGRDLPGTAVPVQVYWNWNTTLDVKREYWANYLETGPGVRFRVRWVPPSMLISINALRGAYFIMAGNPHPQMFNDLRIGVWYAFTH